MREEILRMERVSYEERGVMQLENFSLHLFAGEITGLLPLNNHGITALLRLLQHNSPLCGGYVYYREKQVNNWQVSKAWINRIGIIQGQSCLVDDLTVADNIFVLKPGFQSWMVRPRIFREQLEPFLSSAGIDISAGAYVKDLSVFQRVVVELVKAVVAGCKLAVLRDIGSYISEPELLRLHELLNYYAGQGMAFLYIDFHAEELQRICDQVALMENGRVIKILENHTLMSGALVRYTEAFDRKVRRQAANRQRRSDEGEVLFTAENITGNTICGLNFSVRRGECLVLQVLDNQIFSELLRMLSGEEKQYGGRFLLEGATWSPRGGEVAIIQELPAQTMLFQEMSYLDNLCFTLDHHFPELWRSAAVRKGIQRELARELGTDVFDQRLDTLSEMQKYELVYTRVALQKPKVVFCVQPFRRADLELRMHIWELLKRLLDKEITLVVLAVNLADTLSLADRLIRVDKDSLAKPYERGDLADAALSAPWQNVYEDPALGAKLRRLEQEDMT